MHSKHNFLNITSVSGKMVKQLLIVLSLIATCYCNAQHVEDLREIPDRLKGDNYRRVLEQLGTFAPEVSFLTPTAGCPVNQVSLIS